MPRPMTRRLRKLALTAHVTFSVGWLGAVAAYLALAVTGLSHEDVQPMRGAYLAMESIGWLVIVPCSIGALLSGLVQSLGTEWGLFRHYWVVSKLALTSIGTLVLLVHMRAVGRGAALAHAGLLPSGDTRALQVQLVVHAAGGLVVLLAATALSVYKPWGKTPFGRRPERSASP